MYDPETFIIWQLLTPRFTSGKEKFLKFLTQAVGTKSPTPTGQPLLRVCVGGEGGMVEIFRDTFQDLEGIIPTTLPFIPYLPDSRAIHIPN
jgi:hypothetical protein